jgi:hypothetical protein
MFNRLLRAKADLFDPESCKAVLADLPSELLAASAASIHA